MHPTFTTLKIEMNLKKKTHKNNRNQTPNEMEVKEKENAIHAVVLYICMKHKEL